jgi:hypothetical protein
MTALVAKTLVSEAAVKVEMLNTVVVLLLLMVVVVLVMATM